jgi:hypothetical protein
MARRENGRREIREAEGALTRGPRSLDRRPKRPIAVGEPQDYVQAVVWWRRAADQGNALAQGSLGLAYAIGQGVMTDYAQPRYGSGRLPTRAMPKRN